MEKQWVLIWFLFGVVAAIIGSKKGEGLLAFIIGLLLGPLGVLFAIISTGYRMPCPQCKESIHQDAKLCPHCRTALAEQGQREGETASWNGSDSATLAVVEKPKVARRATLPSGVDDWEPHLLPTEKPEGSPA